MSPTSSRLRITRICRVIVDSPEALERSKRSSLLNQHFCIIELYRDPGSTDRQLIVIAFPAARVAGFRSSKKQQDQQRHWRRWSPALQASRCPVQMHRQVAQEATNMACTVLLAGYCPWEQYMPLMLRKNRAAVPGRHARRHGGVKDFPPKTVNC